MKKSLAIGIKGERGMSEAEVIRWGESCLIGSQSRIDLLMENRIRGAARKHADRVGDIVTAKGVALFSLSADENFVEPEKLLQIINNEGPRPSEIVLLTGWLSNRERFIASHQKQPVARPARH